tara:strand:+ start:8056 stop:10290 length:2235 start_codon:yes stop_codon:yes gene_type:complete
MINDQITRRQTITIEASQKQSISKTNNEYETILTKGIEINNGDTIQISSCYCDTTDIDPGKIIIDDDIIVDFQNCMYIINQQLTTLIPSSKRAPRAFMTDNLPYTLCEYQVAGGTDMIHILTARVEAGLWHVRQWGGISFFLQYKDGGGSIVRKLISLPDYFDDPPPFGAVRPSREYVVDIVCDSSYPVQAIEPSTGKITSPPNQWSPDAYDRNGGIYIPYYSQTDETVDTGIFHPVINKGQFTIKAGSYTPQHLAQTLTDNFSFLNVDDLRNKIVRPTGKVILNGEGIGNLPVGAETYGWASLASGLWLDLPYGFEDYDKYLGWTLRVRFASGTVAPLTFTTQDNTIIERKVGQQDYQFALLNLWTEAVPANVQVVFDIIPSETAFDLGSKFLQTTMNYQAKGPDGANCYAFVDCNKDNPNNILTFPVLGIVAQAMVIGSNQMEVIYDEDIKRFKFNYIHFPFTAGLGSAPALVKQINAVNETNGTTGVVTYVNDYDKGSVNQVSASYGGVFFTHLEPESLFKDLMGFNYTDKSIIASVIQNSTTHDFKGGPDIGSRVAVEYSGVTTPEIKLIYGQHITRQQVSIADMIGEPSNYTTYEPIIAQTPSIVTGRVLVDRTQVQSIIAENNGLQIGVQDSGFYVFEVELGMQYNMSIGSSNRKNTFTRNIRAIVDRYYSVNSYTSSQGSNTEYIHYGQPTIIKSIKVTIRNSNGLIIDHLGDDNSVFINIIKNNIVDIQPPPNDKK